jgi:uncharacterized PurR-regulated membrane protein YhhQ (DUF165 family)
VNRVAVVCAAALVSCVVVANLLVTHLAPIPVGFGLLAPAGVLVAGLAFTIRDLLDRAGGRRWVLGAIAVGTVVSLLMGTGVIAFAAAVAFAVSELLDWLTFRALRGNFLAAVAVSGVVGLLVDSLLFCWLAFGDLAFVPGQILGKAYALAAVVVLLYVTRRRVTA